MKKATVKVAFYELYFKGKNYLFFLFHDLELTIRDCAADNLAIGTLYGEQLT